MCWHCITFIHLGSERWTYDDGFGCKSAASSASVNYVLIILSTSYSSAVVLCLVGCCIVSRLLLYCVSSAVVLRFSHTTTDYGASDSLITHPLTLSSVPRLFISYIISWVPRIPYTDHCVTCTISGLQNGHVIIYRLIIMVVHIFSNTLTNNILWRLH